MCAVAGGYAYVIDTAQPEHCTHIALKPVVEVMPLGGAGAAAICRLPFDRGVGAQRPRVGVGAAELGGSSHHQYRGNVLHGTGWNLMTDREVAFSLDLLTGQHQGGGFTPPQETKKLRAASPCFNETSVFECAVALSELGLAAVFRNNEGVGSKNRAATNAAEKVERAGVFVLGLIRWIEVDEIDRLRQLCRAVAAWRQRRDLPA